MIHDIINDVRNTIGFRAPANTVIASIYSSTRVFHDAEGFDEEHFNGAYLMRNVITYYIDHDTSDDLQQVILDNGVSPYDADAQAGLLTTLGITPYTTLETYDANFSTGVVMRHFTDVCMIHGYDINAVLPHITDAILNIHGAPSTFQQRYHRMLMLTAYTSPYSKANTLFIDGMGYDKPMSKHDMNVLTQSWHEDIDYHTNKILNADILPFSNEIRDKGKQRFIISGLLYMLSHENYRIHGNDDNYDAATLYRFVLRRDDVSEFINHIDGFIQANANPYDDEVMDYLRTMVAP